MNNSCLNLSAPFGAICAGLVLGCTASFAQPAATATGAFAGRVFNVATGDALMNARVALPGQGREAITDETGRFRLAGLPSGPLDVRVSYVGMEMQTTTVHLIGGTTVHRDFELRLERTGYAIPEESVRLDAFRVVEDREMSAQAIAVNEQRHAPNLKNVVAIDEFGVRGDENIGEFLRFLPGVTVEDSGHTAIEVSLRGLPSNTTAFQVDGAELAASRGGESRSTQLVDVPTGNLSRVEVTKVSTPDMSASGLGGSINLISKSGFEARRPKLSLLAYQILHTGNGLTLHGGRTGPGADSRTSPGWAQPSLSFSYLHPVNRNLAITIGGSRVHRIKPMETGKVGESQETAEWNLVNGVLRSATWASLRTIFWTVNGNAGIEWRVSPRDTLSLSFQARESQSYLTRSQILASFGTAPTGDATFVQGAAAGTGTMTLGNGAWQDVRSDARHAILRHRHRGDVWRFDTSGSWSRSTTGIKDLSRGHFRAVTATIPNLVIRGEGIPREQGFIPTRYSAVTRTGSSVDLYDGANYSITNATSIENGDYQGENLSARFDVARDFPALASATLKVGAVVNRVDKDVSRHTTTWNFRPNGSTDATARLAGNFPVFDEDYNATAPTLYGYPVRWISERKVYQLFQERPDWFVLDDAGAHQNRVTASKELSETISAGYLRADFRLLERRLWLVTGVRFERTDVEGRGPWDDINAQYQRNPDGSFVRNAAGQRVLITSDTLALRKLRYVERGAHAERNYGGWYPSLNVTYNFSDNLLLRAGYARNLGRPNANFIMPGTTVTEPDMINPTITVSNSSLKPWTADSFDVTLESYPIKGGVGSVGVFRKSIKNFFGVVRTPVTPELLELYGLENDPILLNYEISTRTNVGDAQIDGFEFNYRQNLTFLPTWARGLQVFVSTTQLNLSGSNTADFSSFNKSISAGGVNFVRPRFFFKLSFTHLPAARRGLVAANAATGIPADTYNYQSSRMRWAVSTQYSLSRRWAVYGEMNDVIQGFQPMTYRYAPDTPEHARGQARQSLGAYFTLGVKGTF